MIMFMIYNAILILFYYIMIIILLYLFLRIDIQHIIVIV